MITKTLTLTALLLALTATAQTPIALLWDPVNYPSVTNYFVYGGTNASFMTNLATSQVKLSAGTNTAAAVVVPINYQWFFVVTATAFGMESLPSNVVTNRPPAPQNNRQWFPF